MKSKEEIFSRVQTIFAETFDLEKDKIKLETHLFNDLDLDSLDAIDLSGNLATEINLRISETELLTIRTVADVVDLVHKKLET